jgi:hypothetical protein
MKVYGQLFLAGCANPEFDEYIEFDSIGEAKRRLEREHEDCSRFSDEMSSAVLFLGRPDPDWVCPCDGYPDIVLETTPRGAVKRLSI